MWVSNKILLLICLFSVLVFVSCEGPGEYLRDNPLDSIGDEFNIPSIDTSLINISHNWDLLSADLSLEVEIPERDLSVFQVKTNSGVILVDSNIVKFENQWNFVFPVERIAPVPDSLLVIFYLEDLDSLYVVAEKGIPLHRPALSQVMESYGIYSTINAGNRQTPIKFYWSFNFRDPSNNRFIQVSNKIYFVEAFRNDVKMIETDPLDHLAEWYSGFLEANDELKFQAKYNPVYFSSEDIFYTITKEIPDTVGFELTHNWAKGMLEYDEVAERRFTTEFKSSWVIQWALSQEEFAGDTFTIFRSRDENGEFIQQSRVSLPYGGGSQNLNGSPVFFEFDIEHGSNLGKTFYKYQLSSSSTGWKSNSEMISVLEVEKIESRFYFTLSQIL